MNFTETDGVPTSITVPISCPDCGSPVRVEATSAPRSREQRMVLRCVTRPGPGSCGHRFVFVVQLVTADIDTEGNAAAHGSDGGYMRHLRHNEKPCDDCRLAHNEVARIRKAQRKALVTA